MFQKICLIGCFLFASMSVFSQETTIVVKQNKIPASIYLEKDAYSFLKLSLTTNLKFKNFKFLIVDQNNVNDNLFTVDFRNIGRKGSTFSYESYNKADLYKYIPAVPDIMMLHRFTGTDLDR